MFYQRRVFFFVDRLNEDLFLYLKVFSFFVNFEEDTVPAH